MTVSDQATDLRELVRQCAVPHVPSTTQRLRRVVVFGGKGGVGTTTIAVNLAVAMARRKVRSLLIDAAGSDAAILCGIEPRHTLADVLRGSHGLVEALQAGPAGVQILPGCRGVTQEGDIQAAAWDNLLAQAPAASPRLGAVVLDGGSQPDRTANRLWQAADHVLLVAAPEPAAIMGTYAIAKLLAEKAAGASVSVVVNLAPSREAAEEVHGRIVQACRRFLGLSLPMAGWVPCDTQVPRATAAGEPVMIASPDCPASRQIDALAGAIMQDTYS